MQLSQANSTSSIKIGHCNYNPGTPEWKSYQMERSSQLRKLKDDREKRVIILEHMRKVQRKIKTLEELDEMKNMGTKYEEDASDPNPAKKSSATLVQPNSALKSKSRKLSNYSSIKTVSFYKPKSQRPRTDTTNKRSKLNREKAVESLRNPARLSQTVPISIRKKPELQPRDNNPNHHRSEIDDSSPRSPIESKMLVATLGEMAIPMTEIEKRRWEVKTSNKLAPKCPILPLCTAFPGTKEWEDYWKLFKTTMDNYNNDMAEFQKGMEEFTQDLDMYKKEAIRMRAEERLFKAGMELLNPTPPPISTTTLNNDCIVFNGYLVKAKNVNVNVSDQLGHPKGIRVEIDMKGVDPDLVLIDREFHMLTISINSDRFIRIGSPDGKLAKDMEIYPGVYPQSIMIVDSR